jgi:hypothetical protein
MKILLNCVSLNPVIDLVLSYSTEVLYFANNMLEGSLPTEIGQLTKLSEYYHDWHNDVEIVILIILFAC